MGAPKGNCFNPNGRPEKDIDWLLFEDLCAIQCTQEEIAGLLRLHPDTLRARVKKQYEEDYTEIYKRYSANGKSSLRRNQFNLSKTNAAMAIWLGKQWLDQKENNPIQQIPEEYLKPYDAIMKQLGMLQQKIVEKKQTSCIDIEDIIA